MLESESGTFVSSTSARLGTTPRESSFSSLRVDSLLYDRKPMSPLACLPLDITKRSQPHMCFTHFPTLDVSLARKVGAEFVGTFILIFAATAAPIINEKYNAALSPIGNAACAGIAAMIVIMSTGHISGAHLNPSLTIAFAALRHFPWVQVPAYIAAQVSASICASFALKGVFYPFMSGGATVPSVGTAQAFALEFLIAFNLLFVVTAVATDTRAVGELAGIAVGATVMLNILIAGPSTGGSMNPVRTLGPAVAAGNYTQLWLYMVAPTLGAVVGAGTYAAVKLKDDEVTNDSLQGFDVPFFRYAVVPGLIVPVFNLEVYKDQLVRYGALAIEHYNDQNGTDFEIVEFVKLNVGVVQGLDYYMTFKAKPSGSLFTTTFQALVSGGIDETEVDICRKLVPSP